MRTPRLIALSAFLAAASPARAGDLHTEEIVVTANRIEQRRADVAESVSVITKEDVRRSAAQTVDDLLRQVPGFSLFRRSSSLVAHPTTQGVSLRGIAPSGVSRTLVLLDGVPLNDPFGGWVYWSRIPVESVERIEIVRGGGSGLWGSSALGGVIHVLTDPGPGRAARVTAQGGELGTYRVDAAASERKGALGVSLGGGYFSTDGYSVVREDQRGAIDEDAASRGGLFSGRIDYRPSDASEWSVYGGFHSEERDNGTPLTENQTEAGTFGARGRLRAAEGEWRIAGYVQRQTFESTFSAQEADRSSESPALDQFDVPSTGGGASLQWVRSVGRGHVLNAGSDFRGVDGETNEDFRFLEGRFTRRRKAGGDQQQIGVYAEDLWQVTPRLHLTLAVRGDLWRSLDLFRRERSLEDGQPIRDEEFSDRDRGAVSPKVAGIYHLSDRLALRGSFYQGFRTPTLNELVRPFRVRNDITEANAGLDPERLLGGEAGAECSASGARARITGFWNELENPIANVTVGTGPGAVEPCGFVPEGGVCRQRRNLDRSRVRGIETDLEIAPHPAWLASVGYLFSDTEIREAPAEPTLEGNRIAQVPRHQLVGKLALESAKWLDAMIQVRYVGSQFEDDQNTMTLGDFAVVDLFLGRELRPGIELFVAGENLFDRRFPVGKTADGLVTVGAPRLIRGGVRIRL